MHEEDTAQKATKTRRVFVLIETKRRESVGEREKESKSRIKERCLSSAQLRLTKHEPVSKRQHTAGHTAEHNRTMQNA